MKPPGQSRHFLIAFILAAVLYGVAYYLMEHLRTRNGPWQINFVSVGGTNSPVLIINEPQLHISDFHLDFPAQSASPTNTTIVFNQVRETPFDLPFGKCIFMDARSQPGTLTFTLFGHEIQLLPRTLTVDKKDYDWRAITHLQVLP